MVLAITNGGEPIQVWIVCGSDYIRLQVQKSDTIHNLGARIRHLLGLNPDNILLLTFSEHPQTSLEGNCTLAQYDVVNGSFIFVEIQKNVPSDGMDVDQLPVGRRGMCVLRFHISVINGGTGETFIMDVESSNTVRDLKQKLQDWSGIDTHQQKLFFGRNELVNTFRLSDYCILGGSILHLDTSRNWLKIFIKTVREGNVSSLEVKSSDTIGMVKAQISELDGTPVDLQNLHFNAGLLAEDLTLSECNIHHGSTLHLLISKKSGPIQIFVTTANGRSMTLVVTGCDTVGTVKIKLQDELVGVRPYDMKLYFKGQKLDNGLTLNDYAIHNNSSLSLFIVNRGRLKINVKALSGGKMIASLDVKSSDRISNLKALIHHSEGIPQDQQLLLFEGKLLDDRDTVASCYLHSDATIDFMHYPKGQVKILIRLAEKTMTMEVDSSKKISYVKEKIKHVEGIPSYQPMTLLYNGEELEDCSTILDCNIHWNSVLHLKVESEVLMEITIQSERGVKTDISVTVGSSYTVGKVKAKILEKAGFPIKDLLWKGIILDESRTLAEYNIQEGSRLKFLTVK